MGKFIDLTGKQFNRWHVIKRGEDKLYLNGRKTLQWLCWCDCEKNKCIEDRQLHLINTRDLTSGHTKSCGCIKRENKVKRQENHFKQIEQNKIKRMTEKYKNYDLSGEYGIGYTTNQDNFGRNYFYFDLEDFDKIKDYTWRFGNKGEVVTMRNGTSILLHRIIMGVNDFDIQIDHIKHKRYDNRKSQLRLVDNSRNQMNVNIRKDNRSGYKGVSWHKHQMMWYVYINVQNKRIHLGYFNNLQDAVNTRKQAEEKYYGKYSYANSMLENKY